MEFINGLKMNRNNLFWNHVLEAWMQLYNSSKPQYSTDILSINLWDNADIIIGNKAVFLSYLVREKNILYKRSV